MSVYERKSSTPPLITPAISILPPNWKNEATSIVLVAAEGLLPLVVFEVISIDVGVELKLTLSIEISIKSTITISPPEIELAKFAMPPLDEIRKPPRSVAPK